MSIKVSEHILSLDENILAVNLFSSQFNTVEKVSRPGFDRKFKFSLAVEESGPSRAAAVYEITRLLEDTFGRVEKITVDHQDVKLMLISLENRGGFVGLVLNKIVNSDYLALKISAILDEEADEIDALT